MFRNFFVCFIILMLSGCSFQNKSTQSADMGIVGENEPVTRAEAARMVSLDKYSLDDINKMERTITFEDTDITKWYDKYINSAFTAGLIAGVDSEHFAPEEYLSLRQAQFLLDKLSSDGSVRLRYAQEDKDKPIPYSIWVTAFEKCMDKNMLSTGTYKIYADCSQCRALGDNYYITELGVTEYEGDEKIDSSCEINAIVSKDAIAALKSVNKIKEYNDLEVVECGSGYVKVKVPAGVRRFRLDSAELNMGDKINIEVDDEGYHIKKGAQ